MNTQPKPTWLTLFSLSAVCVAAFFLIVPLLSHPIAEAVVSLIIAIALFDVVALWTMANKDALEREFSPREHRDTVYRYYAPVRQPAKKQAAQKPGPESDDEQKDV